MLDLFSLVASLNPAEIDGRGALNSIASGSFRRPISITLHEIVAFVSCFSVGAMCMCLFYTVYFKTSWYSSMQS